MVKKSCAWCGKIFPGSQKYLKKRNLGPWQIYFYQCPKCYRYTGIDYKLDVKSKMTRSDMLS